MNVYTYYEVVPNLWSEQSQKDLLKVWHRSWAKAGWTPVVLNERFVSRHPRFSEIKNKIWQLPTEYGHDYEGACFMRWLAVAHAGGGMLVDYDVINYGFAPRKPDPTKMVILSDEPFSMGAVLGTAQHYQAMMDIFADWKVDKHDYNKSTTYDGYHCSDMTMLIRQLLKKNYPCPEWLRVEPGCAQFNSPTGKTASLVHYTCAMKSAGFWPKADHIERIRPF